MFDKSPTTALSDPEATSGDGTKSESDPAQMFVDAEEAEAAGRIVEILTAGVEAPALGYTFCTHGWLQNLRL
ncbi:hypothetical protein PInf_005897 [Phytophthora infestans]|nr:hypothetical protein PInf_005897 [Phytophthora infestans]